MIREVGVRSNQGIQEEGGREKRAWGRGGGEGGGKVSAEREAGGLGFEFGS